MDRHQPASFDYELLVDRGHVLQGLQIFRVPRTVRPRDRAILGFDGAYLTVEAFDQMFVARATGAWSGNARVSATFVAALKQAVPAVDPLVLRCDGERVSIGTMRIDCEWQPVSETLTRAPAVRDWVATLALRYTMPRGRIVTQGLAKEVADAEHKLSQLVVRVAKSLGPLGVTTQDVRSLVEMRLGERYGGRQAEGAAGNTQSVAWMPDPAHALDITGQAATVTFGAIEIEPNTEMTPRLHEAMLAGRVQDMLMKEDDPEAALNWAVRERFNPYGLTGAIPPSVEGAGVNLLAAMEGFLQQMGILTSKRVMVPNRDDPVARAAIEQMTFEQWVEGVTPSES